MSDDGELLVVDALETQRRFAYLGRPLVRAGEPSEYLSSALLERVAPPHCFFQRYSAPVPALEVLLQHLISLDHRYCNALLECIIHVYFFLNHTPRAPLAMAAAV